MTYRDEQNRVWEPEVTGMNWLEIVAAVFGGGMAITTAVVCMFL